MKQLNKLTAYLDSKLIQYEIEGTLIKINNLSYSLVDESAKIFDEDMDFLPTCKEEVDGLIYEFAGRWYTNVQEETLTLTELIYQGGAKQKIPTNNFLGIRSGYELGNGLGNYSTYINKAKFLGTTALGICEKNTLAGVLDFQKVCLKNNIKPVTGMTITIKGKNCIYDSKVYAKNFQGWLALLKFNEMINVHDSGSIELSLIDYYKEDIYIVADPKSMPYNELEPLFNYYQLDTVSFVDEEKDKWYTNNLEQFLKGDLEPISITDSFYLEQEDFQTREFMWTFLKKFDEQTSNQYFKNKDQYAKELIQMFDDKSWVNFFKVAIKNEKELTEGCSFVYDTTTRHLPKYIMTEGESEMFESNEKLFLHLIKLGMKEKGLQGERYIERLKAEIVVLKSAEVIDYFLSQYDVMKWARDRDMLTGIGRGSAGGSLIAYLLNITRMNPLDFDLLFERFLNIGRMGFFEDRPEYTVSTDDGKNIVFQEGDLIRISRNNRETVVFIEDLKENDEIIRF
jgi:DNA polymerase-3 subunit alpha